MIRLKFKDDSIQRFNHKPAGRTKKVKQIHVENYNKLYANAYQVGIEDFDLFDNGNKVLVNIIYNKLHPKTGRYKFRNLITNINDIPQRDTQIFDYEGNTYLSVIYELTKIELESFLFSMSQVFEILGGQATLNDINELKVQNPKIFSVFEKIKNILIVRKPHKEFDTEEKQYVQLYKVGDIEYIINLLSEYNITILESEIVDSDSIIFELNRNKISMINREINWLIMDVFLPKLFNVGNLNEIDVADDININPIGTEPIIGVIDTGFNPISPLFSFVVSIEDKREHRIYHDYKHGTSVSSLIIANDEINPTNSDGLGNFRVKHFELLEPININSEPTANWAFVYTKIKEIVESNQSIKVWNLSLGGPRLNPFTISPHGLLLDKLSNKFDCIFVVASGNNGSINPKHSLASPADSINNISVGSVTVENQERGGTLVKKADYSSKGYVLQSIKPDVSHFGGPTLLGEAPALVHNGFSFIEESGTSFSAPKVARYAGYLFAKGYSSQEIKAKIISLAIKEKPALASSRYGIIKPINISYEINQTIPLYEKDIIVYGIKIPDNVDKIIMTLTYSAIPISKLGYESSVYDIDIKLCEYNPEQPINISTGERRRYLTFNEIKSSTSEIKLANEENLRFSLGKYSTSKKKIINWEKKKNSYDGEKIGIIIKRLDLHDVVNPQVIKASMNISFIGQNLDSQDFININNVETYVEQEVEIVY